MQSCACEVRRREMTTITVMHAQGKRRAERGQRGSRGRPSPATRPCITCLALHVTSAVRPARLGQILQILWGVGLCHGPFTTMWCSQVVRSGGP